MPCSIWVSVSQFSTFPSFIFSIPAWIDFAPFVAGSKSAARAELKPYPLKLKPTPGSRLNFSLAIGSPFPLLLLYDKDLPPCLAGLLSVRLRARG